MSSGFDASHAPECERGVSLCGDRFVRPTISSPHLAPVMNILLLGSGGREHALAWKIAASPLVTKLWCAPGNAGIAREAECVALDIADHPAVIDFCKTQRGRSGRGWPGDAACRRHCRRSRRGRHQGVRTGQAGGPARGIEGFTKALCTEFNIPTGAYGRFTTADDALAYVRAQGAPIVVKADGLAAGKGVVVAIRLMKPRRPSP